MLRYVEVWAYIVLLACRHSKCWWYIIIKFQAFLVSYTSVIKYTCIFCTEIEVFLCIFFVQCEWEKLCFDLLHSSSKVYYNHCIQCKVIIQPEQSYTTLHLHYVMLLLFLPTLVSQMDTVTFSNFVRVYFLCRALHKKTSVNLKTISSSVSQTPLKTNFNYCQTSSPSLIDNDLSKLIKYTIVCTAQWLQVSYSFFLSEKLVVRMVMGCQYQNLLTPYGRQ